MTSTGEAVIRYHKILESDAHKDFGLGTLLQERMKAQQPPLPASPSRQFFVPILSPVVSTRILTKAAEFLITAINRVETIAIGSPAGP